MAIGLADKRLATDCSYSLIFFDFFSSRFFGDLPFDMIALPIADNLVWTHLGNTSQLQRLLVKDVCVIAPISLAIL